MKILVLQLARLGDIFQTWPTLHALNRQGAEVHMLVRPRFRAAASECDGLVKIHEFDTERILAPALELNDAGMAAASTVIEKLLRQLDEENFDRIINLSFSPLASWITFDLEMRAFQRGKTIAVAGYTRHVDGTLAIPDDASAFFFAQVGYRAQTGSTESVNRLSLPRLFATIAGVDPIEADWRGPSVSRQGEEIRSNFPEQFVAIHIGASDEEKTLDAAHWADVAIRLARRTDLSVFLLGSGEEQTKADEILRVIAKQGFSVNRADDSSCRITSLVGKTKVSDLFGIVRQAKILIAGDSALLQIASLVGTKALNLSSRSVSHWETGPSARGSRILLYGGAAPATEVITREALSMLSLIDEKSVADRIVNGPLEEIVEATGDGYTDFMWQLIAAIYLGHSIPRASDAKIQGVIEQWREVQNIENYQLESLKAGQGDVHQIAQILDRVDEVTRLLVQAEPRLSPIERWWSTEKIRCGPQPQDVLVEKFLTLNAQLGSVLLSLQEIEGIHDGHQLDI